MFLSGMADQMLGSFRKGLIMFPQRLIGVIVAGALTCTTAAAEVLIRVAPPHVRVEKRHPRPSRNHVWVPGYHRWDGNAYAWTTGRWEQPPRPHGRWVPHHYVHKKGGWVFVEGHWR